MNEEISRYIYNYGIDKCKVKDVKMRLSKIKVCGYFKGKNNLDIYYEKYYIKEEKGAIVISHGFSECIDKFIEMIYYFIGMGYSVYAIEHRGHGRSGHLSKTDKTQVNIDKFENYVEDLKIFLDKIVTKNSSDLYLYAHSMGGAIATMFLEKYNGYFKKAILSAPMMEIETGKFSKPIVYIVSSIYIMAGKGESYLFGHGPFDGKYNLEMSGASNKYRYKNHLEELKSNEELQRSGGSFKWCFEALRATDYILKKRNIKNINIPILLFQSGKDTFVRERGQNKFCKCANICNKIKFENMGILINKLENIFSLQTKNTSYVFGIDNEGLVRNLYWGSKINDIEDYDMPVLCEVSTNDPVYEITREEYPVYGSLRYKENCLKATFADKSRELVYKYIGYDVKDDELIIRLKDNHYDFNINLHYKVYDQYDLIERYVSVKNNSNDIIEIEKIHSGQFHIPYEGLNFSNVNGHWGAEQQRFVQKVNYGKIVIENRRGISSHNHNPYFVLDKDATETTGEVFFGALKLTGNFSGIIEQTQYGETLVQMGINSHDFLMKLNPEEEFVTPAIIAGYSNSGFEAMTHNLHNFAKDNVLRKGTRPVLYNSWEATEFKVSCDEQIKLAEEAKKIGAELFVVDDGWFGERHGIDNGLGDWYVNKEKFPEGLNPLINKVKEMDMMFGIWVEPEMVNPLSELYKNNPDWIYHFETRESDTSRGQYVLNLTKEEVKRFVYDMLDNLLSTYDIDYIKWDANRPMSQTDVEKDIWYKHIEAIYDIVRELKVKHPNVLFEACASGGGRIDYGILGIFDDFWTSDNTDAYDRLFVQDSYSYIYPIKAMRAWVTDCPNFLSRRVIPMKFRYHSAMMGTLGIGCNILKFNEEEVKLSQELIREYKEIRHIIQEGDFYRLENTSKNDYKIYQYNKDAESLLFVFLPQSLIGHRGTTVKLRGLESESKYIIKINGEEIIKSGSYLMNKGLEIRLVGDYASDIIRINKF